MNASATLPPKAWGLYRPEFEHDACGIGALANVKGVRTHQMLSDALSVLQHGPSRRRGPAVEQG